MGNEDEAGETGGLYLSELLEVVYENLLRQAIKLRPSEDNLPLRIAWDQVTTELEMSIEQCRRNTKTDRAMAEYNQAQLVTVALKKETK
ncbi:hypothetical protein LCGC14_1333250 [marine sediment metagenome]|uniref:Uncharacterized protein n=1 Tax=marine sediment metagenome TaxID=412755 RepID=A0A0F9L1Y4_9ZZZZ